MSPAYPSPRRWNDPELDADRLGATTDFIAERAAATTVKWRAAYAEAVAEVTALLDATDDLTNVTGAVLAANPTLVEAARFTGGPAISADDLATVAAAPRKFTKLSVAAADRIATVIVAGLDQERFPWLDAGRAPTTEERTRAIMATAPLRATQRTATARRGESAARQEEAVKVLLRSKGFKQVPRRDIDAIGDLGRGEFCPEAKVFGVKCDVPVGLRNNRYLFIECKVSSTAVNSVKRLNRETGGKAAIWRDQFGAQAYTAAVLAGVFRLKNLKDAQDAGVYIYWERDLTPLADFLDAAV